MKIRMLVQIAGLRDNERWPAPGETKTLPDAEGARMCQRGYAEPVVEDRVEKAVPKKRAELRKATEKKA